MAFKQLSLIFFAVLLMLSTSGCDILLGTVTSAALHKVRSTDSYSVTDTHTFDGPEDKRYYRDMLVAVGEDMNFTLNGSTPETLIWTVKESNALEEYALGKYSGTIISVAITAATTDTYQFIPGKKTLTLTVSSQGNFNSLSREDVNVMFGEILRRFDEKIAAAQ